MSLRNSVEQIGCTQAYESDASEATVSKNSSLKENRTHEHHTKSYRVVHASGYFSVQSCKCGSVIVEMGNMSYRLTDEGFVEFARTVGAAFEKITGEKTEMLGVEMATANTHEWDETASDGTKEVLN